MTLGDPVQRELVHLLFEPDVFGKMHTVAYASGSGTNFNQAVLGSREPGANYSVDFLVTDKLYKKKGQPDYIGAINFADGFGIPYTTINGFDYCGSWAEAQKTVGGIREYEKRCQKFNMELYKAVREYEKTHSVHFDFAVLAGYMRLFKGSLLRRFNGAALNVHPAELSKFNEDGLRKYIGDKAVFDALAAGEERTRSSIILLDPETDAGAILVSGPWVEYTGKRPVTPEEADEHQSKQKEKSDWPALRFALHAIADGEIGLHKRKHHHDGNPVVVYKGIEMPYEGHEMAG